VSRHEQEIRHPIFARLYAVASRAMEQGGMADHRRRFLGDVAGRVLEIGAGNGLNFSHYPAMVTSVRAVEPEPHLRTSARRAAAQAPVPITVVAGTAEHLPAADDEYDAVVVSLTLCSVADQSRALAEIGRVLRPGGTLHFLEHVRAEGAALRQIQRVVDATFWPLVFGGCHAGRDTVAAIVRSGFTIDRLHHFVFPDSRVQLPTSPHVDGVAIWKGTA
jgi:ubiquinone/menaquinone biosynthesis C-methylase UbiE